MNRRIVVVIGAVLAVLAVLTASAAADNVFYLVPQNSSAAPGENVTVLVMLNASDVTDAFDATIYFDPAVVNITAWENPEPGFWVWWDVGHHGNYIHAGGMNFADGKSGLIGLANLTLTGINPGVSALHFDPEYSGCGYHGNPLPATYIDGSFTCTAPQETFTKPLAKGWNLISLPLTADDMTVSSVFSSVAGKYDALYRYDASTHSWVALSSDDTLENGVGYFIHMTENGTWTYNGSAYTDMNISLQRGLNMIGWLNCSKNISDALSSIEGDYWYVARWNATAQKFEVYNPVAPPAFNDFTTMERGEGYFISMKSAGTLTESCR
ncbi:MAG: hypothetical protein DRN64_01980 [Thaumarchaeota archaeon]|nr:MAG: hypothetical protein DRN64_01980 [Nitrososphaerota archaeon]